MLGTYLIVRAQWEVARRWNILKILPLTATCIRPVSQARYVVIRQLTCIESAKPQPDSMGGSSNQYKQAVTPVTRCRVLAVHQTRLCPDLVDPLIVQCETTACRGAARSKAGDLHRLHGCVGVCCQLLELLQGAATANILSPNRCLCDNKQCLQ